MEYSIFKRSELLLGSEAMKQIGSKHKADIRVQKYKFKRIFVYRKLLLTCHEHI